MLQNVAVSVPNGKEYYTPIIEKRMNSLVSENGQVGVESGSKGRRANGHYLVLRSMYLDFYSENPVDPDLIYVRMRPGAKQGGIPSANVQTKIIVIQPLNQNTKIDT